MKTPKKYLDNLKKGILTKEMLGECLFSVNKRAKNHRDKEREYAGMPYCYRYEEEYRSKKEKCYEQKETILRLFNPECIHKETYDKRKRFYDYEPEFYEYENSEKCIYSNEYYDRDTNEIVCFIDVIVPHSSYYLFYDFGNFSFHSPIREFALEYYKKLEIKDIGVLKTQGKNVNDLLSCQFVNKVIDLINKKEYQLVSE